MATFKLANASLGVLAAALIADLDSAASPAYIEVYDGTQAATPGTAITSQVKLGTATMSA
jgi:hypothetical protein